MKRKNFILLVFFFMVVGGLLGCLAVNSNAMSIDFIGNESFSESLEGNLTKLYSNN